MSHFTAITRCLILSALVSFSGCAAITATQSGQSDFTYRPHYEESKNFYLWGLIGEHTVNTRAVCKNRGVRQLQTKYTLTDVALSAVTLGLYMPRTAMVWCQREDSQ